MIPLTKPQKLIYTMEKFSGGAVAVLCGSVLFNGSREPSEMYRAVNELYRINSALRTRIDETGGEAMQTTTDFVERKIETLCFSSKAELDAYAAEYAKQPLTLSGSLCEIKTVTLPEQYGALIKLHHIIGDAWSLSLLASQLCAILEGKAPKAFAYDEYVASEKNYLQSKRREKDRDFFLTQFKRHEEATCLSEKQSDSLASARVSFVLDAEQSRRVSGYAEARHISPFALYLAVLAVYMNRTRQNGEKFYIGTTVLNRAGTREKNTVGMFINTVPVLAELDNERSFAENLAAVEASTFAAFRHQKYNYGDILSDIRGEFGFSERLYDVLLSYQNAKIEGGAESTWYPCGVQDENLQIHIEDRDSEGICKIHYDYRSEIFTGAEIERLHRHLCNLLFDAIGHDGKKLYELDLLTAEERQKLLVDFNDTAVDYPRNKCVHTLFEEQAARTPDKVAVIFKDVALTYSELWYMIDCYAAKLSHCGIRPGDVVAVHLDRSHKLIAFQLAILKIGAIFLPVDKRYPPDRIQFMCSDCNVKLLISDEMEKKIGNTIIISLLDFESLDICEAAQTVSNSGVCYVIYTSGSTGNPKGCALTGSGLTNFCINNNTLKTLHNKNDNIFATVNSVSFDYFIAESLVPLTNGYTTVILDDEESMSQRLFLDAVSRYGINTIMTTPTRLKIYFGDDCDCTALATIDCICTSGEPLLPELLEVLYRKAPNAQVYNPLGPSECTVWNVDGELSRQAGVDIHIGKPIANTQIYIVDKYLRPTPIGVTGELCIAGDGVGAGYLNRPELTAEKFIDNPFGEGKLYKTGDLAYWREDGNIVYVGRNDFQVKIRGLRIELGEIENAIAAVEGVSQAVVVVRKDDAGRQLICAFYTGTEKTAKELRAAIGQKLPKYMLPHIFTHLDTLPLTSSGKISRKALPEVNLSAAERGAEYVAPEGELEQRLATLMERVLSYSPIGREDDFFDLGGDSLKAIELISALEDAGYHTDVKTLFTHTTIRALAPMLTAAAPRFAHGKVTGDVPATDAQMRVYTAQAMQGGTAYNIPYAFRTESVDPNRLQKAVQGLVDRHEAFRTHFEDRDGQVMQIVEPAVSIQVEKLDNEDISAFIRPFDLSKAPLLRVGYYQNTVMVDMHHIISDGGSLPVFFRELNEFYMGRELDEPVVQYRQFAVQPRDYTEDEAYWLSVFADEPPVLEMNTDFRREQNQSYSGAALYMSLDSALHQRILTASRKLRITPYAFYLGGFYALLSKFSCSEDIVVGAPVSGRKGAYLGTLGMFVNTVALRAKPAGSKTVADFLTEVGHIAIDAVAHQGYPYSELVKKLNIRTTDRNPLFDVMFAYQDEAMTDVVFGDKPAELLPIPVTTSKYDFTFNIMPRKDDVVVMAEYCTDLYCEDTVQRLLDGYRLILKQMLDGDILLKDISAITEQERQKLLVDFNDTAADYPRNKCVHTLFEEQAARTPDKVAVIACDRTLTYRELNEQANRIAHGLIAKGVGVGDIVAFALPRRSYLIAAMLGILKTGAAYLPVDPDYPKDRIDYMLSDSNAKVFITENNITELLNNKNTANPNIASSDEDLCCCIYTSGSTGTPKGALLKHGGITNFIYANQRYWKNIDTVVTTTIVTFDAFQQDSILSIAQECQLVLSSKDEIYNQAEFERLFSHSSRNMFFSTPTKMEHYIDGSIDISYLSRIKSFVLGGEVFSEALLEKIRKYSPNSHIFNEYGPTETTICVTVDEFEDESDITIGKPIANTQIYIVDKYLRPTPIGVTGELCITGDGVGAGYLNRPELTAEKFIDNPFGEGKLYKTGDLAYWREDGNIVYVGRNDFQVKIRGLRIELGEIENAIAAVEGVSQAVVVVRKDDAGRQLICAFYTGTEKTAKELRAAIGQKLPKYMLPHIFTHLDTLPLTSSGKISRKALPEVDLSSMESGEEYVKPEGELEKRLAVLMEEVLEYKPIGRNDDFFDLGGDSLRAIEFASKAHGEGIYFALQKIFDHPTVRRLAECITSGNEQQISFADMDFTEINQILSKSKMELVRQPKKTPVGNILLAGATGFLGVHILADYLEHDDGIAFCLVRGVDAADSEKRLNELLQFYFGGRYAVGERIRVICGDLTKDQFGLGTDEYEKLLNAVDTVINAAATVKHFGSYQYFYEINVETVKRLIDFCEQGHARLVHISTTSVSGADFDNGQADSETEAVFSERDLYIDQSLENVYARSKFEAELTVLNAMCRGLQANIMRMGNLTNRASDGVFQKNYESNAFLKRFRAFLELGAIPDYLVDRAVDFTPIDEAAAAVMTITRHFSTEQTVFHIENDKLLPLDRLMEYAAELGYPLKFVDGNAFAEMLSESAKREETEHILETFVRDMDAQNRLAYSRIHVDTAFTAAYLQRFGFAWSEIDAEYLRKYVEYFRKVGYWKVKTQ